LKQQQGNINIIMAIQESDIMDFGNGIIGDDTFDVWRKKTNSLKGEIDLVNTALTNKINTDVAALRPLFVPIAGNATSVSTSLQFTSPVTLTSSLVINGATLTGSITELASDKEFYSSVQLTSPKVKATSKLILGTKEYSVPSSPVINNAVLTSATTSGELQWRNAAELFASAGGLQQTTAVFEEVMPVGTVIACAEDPNDSNFLECNGGSALKSTYPKLYEVLKGTGATARYGETNTSFNLPDYQGRVLVGTGTAGGVTFGTTFGEDGGDTAITTSTSTEGHVLEISEMPKHNHDIQSTERGSGSLDGETFDEGTSGNKNDRLSSTGIRDTGGDEPHSHDINITLTPANRIQPYITVKYYIKAIENTKVDFKIDVNNSGLTSIDGGGTPQTLLSVSNETHSLSVNPDNTSISVVNGQVAIKTNPTIPGTITTTGPDFKLNNSTRAGTNSHEGRALVHGGGTLEGDPVLNGYDRKTVTTINDSGAGINNDTLIINYNDISPNSFGDYTNGVIINGMKAIMFEDGSILQTGERQKGNFKKPTETESGKHNTVAPQYSNSFAYIDNEDNIIIGGNNNGVKARGSSSDDEHCYRTKSMLPDDEVADKLYVQYYATHVIAKSGKTYSVGYGHAAASTSSTQADHTSNKFHTWGRSFCESNNCKMSKIVATGDISSHLSFALDTQGYFWGQGVNGGNGALANGGFVNSYDEPATFSSNTIIGKRESLVNSETATAGVPYNLATNASGDSTRQYLAHPMNPMLDANGNITTNPATAVSLLKVTDATHIGSYFNADYGHLDTVAILSENGTVHVAGYCDNGQDGAGVGGVHQPNWSTVQTSVGVPLENITKLYSGGEDFTTYFVAIDTNYDVWGWGSGQSGQFGTGRFGTDDFRFATKIWDSSSKNRRANYVITNNAGGNSSAGDADAVLIIASHQDSNGVTINKEFHMRNTAGTAMIRLSHTVFNTTAYSIQDMYFSNGNTNNFYYVLARNSATNKLELWSSGFNAHGQLGYQDGLSLTNFANVSTVGETVAYRVNFRSDLLEKVVTIHCCRQYNTGGNTFVHLSDGRIFAVGYLQWGFGTTYGTVADYKYQFSPIEMD
jgi:microcystin-dependent protein